jgi:hypothetical protein
MFDPHDRQNARQDDEKRRSRVCGMIFPLPGEEPHESPAEFAVGIGAWGGNVLLMLGPDGDLYYATLAGDGQVRKIVSSGAPRPTT